MTWMVIHIAVDGLAGYGLVRVSTKAPGIHRLIKRRKYDALMVRILAKEIDLKIGISPFVQDWVDKQRPKLLDKGRSYEMMECFVCSGQKYTHNRQVKAVCSACLGSAEPKLDYKYSDLLIKYSGLLNPSSSSSSSYYELKKELDLMKELKKKYEDLQVQEKRNDSAD